MGYSINEVVFDGDREISLNFTLGYTSRNDVTAEIERPVVNLPLDFDWLTDNQIRVADDSNLEIGDVIVLKRTVSKVLPVADLSQPGQTTRENIQATYLHSVYLVHELLDGRISDTVEVSSEVLSAVTAAVEEAVKLSGLIAEYVYPVQIGGAMTAPIRTGVGNTLRLESDSVRVAVVTPPSTSVELLLYDSEVVVGTVLIDTSGDYTTTVNSETCLEGVLRLEVAGDNYASGLEVYITLQGVLEEYLEFATTTPDFLNIVLGELQ